MSTYYTVRTNLRAALYGKPYLQAAKDTWGLFKDRGIDGLINDQLVSMSTSAQTLRLYVCFIVIYSVNVGRIRRRSAMLALRIPLPAFHASCVQRQRTVHCSRRAVCVLDRVAVLYVIFLSLI